MAVRVCTLMWGTAWERYGKKFAESFTEYWDPSIELALVTDRELEFDRVPNQIELQELEGFRTFFSSWHNNPIHKKGVAEKDLWKWDAVKWMPQGITPWSVLQKNSHWVDGDILVWLDADIITHAKVDEAWIESLFQDDDEDCVCLQRPGVHTEIGFFALKLNPHTRKAMEMFHDMYANYEVFTFNEWHSAYIWDVVINASLLRIRSLNTTGCRTHVFPETILSKKLIHNKGHRKPGGG